MDINRAIDIIEFDAIPKSKDEELEALKVFFQERFKINIQNQNGTYKSIYDIIEEANTNYSKEVAKINES